MEERPTDNSLENKATGGDSTGLEDCPSPAVVKIVLLN